jgi:hypothetical protein
VFIYFFIFNIVSTTSIFLFTNFGFSTTNIDSGRYFLSAMIQSKASIIAIVTTLSLIAIQQNSYYSPRINTLFKSAKTNPDFYILIVVYLFSICYDAWLLKQLTVSSSNPYLIVNLGKNVFFQNMEERLIYSFILSVFSFIALVPYILSTFDLLNPSKIIEILGSNINQKTVSNCFTDLPVDSKINSSEFIDELIKTTSTRVKLQNLQHYKKGNEVHFPYIISNELLFRSVITTEKNPYQPIIEIVHTSLVKSQFEIARIGINVIGKTTKEISRADFKNKFVFSSHLNFELTKLAEISIDKKEEQCVTSILSIIYYSCYLTILKYPEISCLESIKLMEKIGIYATLNKLDSLTYTSQLFLYYLSMHALVQKNKDIIINTLDSIQRISDHSTLNDNELSEESTKMIEHVILIAEQEQLDYLQEIKKFSKLN